VTPYFLGGLRIILEVLKATKKKIIVLYLYRWKQFDVIQFTLEEKPKELGSSNTSERDRGARKTDRAYLQEAESKGLSTAST